MEKVLNKKVNIKKITMGRVQHTNNNASHIMHSSMKFGSLKIVLIECRACVGTCTPGSLIPVFVR
jgi:iron only hydrogenase large subunit-like protein